jgi:GxxExxY protein
MTFDDIAYEVVGCAMRVHNALGPGLREKPYENALVIDLEGSGFKAESQRAYPIFYLEHAVGECIPDITVNRELLFDAKSLDSIGENEQAQMLNYLRISRIELGLIINFRNPKLEWQRVARSRAGN